MMGGGKKIWGTKSLNKTREIFFHDAGIFPHKRKIWNNLFNTVIIKEWKMQE